VLSTSTKVPTKKGAASKDTLQFMVFNSKSNLLLRRLDIRHIMDVLMVKEAVELLLAKVEVLKNNSVCDY